MRAAQLVAYGKPLELREVPKPEPRGQQVLVKIAGAGICHSDLHLIEGRFPLPFLPLTLGHENTGYIESMGKDVVGFTKDDAVAVYGAWNSKGDRFDRKGEGNLSNVNEWVGVGHHGGYADYLLVPSYKYLIRLEDMDPIEATPLVDAGLTSYRAVKKLRDNVYPGSTVLLVGIGGQGQFAVQYTKLILPGVRTVAVDIDDDKLRFARKIGADHTINSSREDALDALTELTDGEGVQGAIDFVGISETMTLAYNSLGRQGKFVIVGLNGGKLEISPDMTVNEAEVTTSNWGTLLELGEVIQLARQKRLYTNIETVNLEDVNDAISRLATGKVRGRVVITP